MYFVGVCASGDPGLGIGWATGSVGSVGRRPRPRDPTGNVDGVTELPVLTPEEQRVLGCLLEKEVTVPASYPLTLNALRTACNQTSSRTPVVDYDERTIQDAMRGLKDKSLGRVTWMDYGRRTLKYAQSAAQELELADDERALLTVLLLRGPQAPGELKTRTERLFGFADREAVEECLARMAAREVPLVSELGRRPGQQDSRWAHLLGGAQAAVAEGPVLVDREQILSDGPAARDRALDEAFEVLADEYADERELALARAPFEWWLLTRAVELADGAPIADVGCGAGAVSAYLADIGADVTGFDRVPAQVQLARRRHPDVLFEEGDLRRLLRPATAAGWGAVVAWDLLNHFAPSELPAVLASLVAPLTVGGVLVVAVETGASSHPTKALGGVEVPWVQHDASELRGSFAAAGLGDVEAYHVLVEGDDRLYLLGRRG